jgi:hypothetical protein
VARFATKNFSERRQRELRRIPLPRTPVNKGKKKGRSLEISPNPKAMCRYSLCSLSS